MKRCPGCRDDLPFDRFHRSSRSRDGLQARCKVCQEENRRKRLERTRARVRAALEDAGGKRCPRCDRVLSLDQFHANKSARDGKQTHCITCCKEVRREYETRNAEVLAMRRAERLARTPDPDEIKRCRKCGVVKPMLAFYAHRSTKDRRANYCMECQKATTREWNKRNAAAIRDRNAAYRLAHPEKRKRDHRQWWLRLYKLTQDDYARLLADQNGVCAVCLQPERYIDARTGEPRNLSVDHDHATGLVRGLLCGRCNRGIGQFGDSVENAQRVVDYLKRAEKASMQT